MNEHFITKDYVHAASRLYQYSQNKRYNVTQNNFSNDRIGGIAKYINEEIKANSGIDVFSSNAKEDLIKYEDTLNSKISEFIKSSISSRDVIDEAEMLKKSTIVDVSIIKNKEISVSESLIKVLESSTLQSADVIKSCMRPDNLAFFKGYSKESRENYMLMTSINIRKNKYNVVAHLGNVSGKENELSVCTYFILTTETDIINDPVRTFLFCLDKYGLDIEINGIVKKIFGNEVVQLNKTFDGSMDFIKVKNTNNDDFELNMTFKIIKESFIELEFVYGVNNKKYSSDLEVSLNKSI